MSINPPVAWQRLTITSTPEILDILSQILCEWGSGGSIHEENSITAYFSPADKDEIDNKIQMLRSELGAELRTEWSFEQGEPWRDEWKKYYKPSRISDRLAVCPSWEDWNESAEGLNILRLDPGSAFGAGTHETTILCMRLMDDLLKVKNKNIDSFLDVGCGAGTLLLAARMLGVPRAAAIDIDYSATAVARENAGKNMVAAGSSFLCGDLRAIRGSFSLVAANILYQVLMGLAPTLADLTAPGGNLILSGMLADEAPSASQLFGKYGFSEDRREILGEWGGLVLTRRAAG